MNKIIFLAFALFVTAQAACPNALGADWNIPQENTAQTTFNSANKVCASLNTNAQSCCLLTTVDGFVDDAADLITALEDASETKDGLILAARKKIADLRTQFIALDAAYTEAVATKLATLNSDVNTWLVDYIADVSAFFENYDDLRTGFDTYQTERGTCLTALVRAEVSGWCLACDTDYLTKGVTDNSGTLEIAYTTALTNSLRDACYDYIAASAQQTDILRLAHFAAPVATYTENLVKLADADDTNDAAAATAIESAIPSGSASGISVIPTGCTDSACTWITTELFADATIDQTAAILGGDAPTRRRLQQSRMLAGEFAATAGETKITLTVNGNPGDLDNPNDLSALRVGVFSCIVAFFVALLI